MGRAAWVKRDRQRHTLSCAFLPLLVFCFNFLYLTPLEKIPCFVCILFLSCICVYSLLLFGTWCWPKYLLHDIILSAIFALHSVLSYRTDRLDQVQCCVFLPVTFAVWRWRPWPCMCVFHCFPYSLTCVSFILALPAFPHLLTLFLTCPTQLPTLSYCFSYLAWPYICPKTWLSLLHIYNTCLFVFIWTTTSPAGILVCVLLLPGMVWGGRCCGDW